MERSVIWERPFPDCAEFIIGPAEGRTRWLHPGYGIMSRRRTDRPGHPIDDVLQFVAGLLVLPIKQRLNRRRSLDKSTRVRDDRWASPLAPHREGQLERGRVRCRAPDQVRGAGEVELARRYRGRPGQREQHARPFKRNILHCSKPLDDAEPDVEIVERGATIAEIAARR